MVLQEKHWPQYDGEENELAGETMEKATMMSTRPSLWTRRRKRRICKKLITTRATRQILDGHVTRNGRDGERDDKEHCK